jgi:DNA-binding NarL/FixJ family response regulator
MSTTGGPARAFRVAVIDDNADVRRLLQIRLDFEHHLEWIGEAHDGVAGMELVLARSPDAVILNVDLPGLDGIRVLSMLRETGFDGVVASYTASSAAVARAMADGANAAFLKTEPVSDVLVCVESLCLAR